VGSEAETDPGARRDAGLLKGHVVAIDSTADRPGSPLWWVNRLYQRLTARRQEINVYDDYYRGDFPLPWLAPQAADDFKRILKMSRANYMGLVIDAQCERMAAEGFRVPDDSTPTRRRRPKTLASPDGPTPSANDGGMDGALANDDMQRIWEANEMDTQFDQGILEAAITGTSYLMVAPNPKNVALPKMWVEHASQTIVAFQAGTNRQEVVAALKVWIDEWTGQTFATLYLPTQIWKFKTDEQHQIAMALEPMHRFASITEMTMPVWSYRSADGTGVAEPNPLGLVPFFEIPNNPRLLTGGQSEIYDLTDTQDRIVKTIADRLMTQDYGAFPQKWASGWPLENAAGVPTPPIQVGRDRMVTTDVVETKFGQFDAADILGYLDAKRSDVTDIASRSRTPAQYLIGEMNNVNGDTLKASESGLVAKVRQRLRGYEPGLEGAAGLAFKLAGHGDLAARGQRLETIWRNPEFRTEGELVDALVKMQTLGVPEEALWERWGATPTEIRRWHEMLQEKMQRAAAGDATVVLAETMRQAAIAPIQAEQQAKIDEKVATAKANGGGANSKGTQPGQPRGTTGTNNRRPASQTRKNVKAAST
jgi:hypothetical protein